MLGHNSWLIQETIVNYKAKQRHDGIYIHNAAIATNNFFVDLYLAGSHLHMYLQ